MTNLKKVFLNGIFQENPVLIIMIGLCSVLAVSVTTVNALGMWAAYSFVLIGSELTISAIRNSIPKTIRIPIFIIAIATFTTIVQLIVKAYSPSLDKSLGIFIPLITVNCIILGRAEAFASKNSVLDSLLDGVGMALGYTLAIAIVSIVREFLGTGGITIWGNLGFVLGKDLETGVSKFDFFTNFFTTPAGGFIVLGIVFGVVALIKNKAKVKKEAASKKGAKEA